MSLFGMFSNPIEFDKRYNMKKLTTKLVKNSNFEGIEKEFHKTKEEIYSLVELNNSVALANIEENKVRAIYIFERIQEEGKKVLKQTDAFYLSSLSESEKIECFRSVAHHAVNKIAAVKYDKIIINDKALLPSDAIIEADAKNPKLRLFFEKAKYFFLAFILATIIDDLLSGIVWGIFCSLAFGGVKVSITGCDFPEGEKEREEQEENKNDII